jgi:hypothetical protein
MCSFCDLDRLVRAEADRLRSSFLAFPEAEPEVYRVRVIGRRNGRPVFRRGRRIGAAAGRSLARRFPGVFVRGTLAQARALARGLGGVMSVPHRDGGGLMHLNVDLPGGQRTHVWFGRNLPTDFFAA